MVGDLKERAAEGMEMVTKHTAAAIADSPFDLIPVPQRSLSRHLRALLVERPDAVVFCHGPGIGALVWSAAYRTFAGSRVMFVATRPTIGSRYGWLRRVGAPALVLATPGSRRVRELCSENGWRLSNVRFGVDRSFVPISFEQKQSIRRRLGWPVDKLLVLHVGHLRSNRGLDVLVDIAREHSASVATILVASPSLEANGALRQELLHAGVSVVDQYQPEMAPIYQAADLYVFPTSDEGDNPGGAIDLPLSVLEAAACGVPIVSRDFGALRDYFRGRQGIELVETSLELVDRVRAFVRMTTEQRETIRLGASTRTGACGAVATWPEYQAEIRVAVGELLQDE